MNNSEAAILRWSKISPEERSRRASVIATKRWKSVTVEDRRKHSLKMLSGKKIKSMVS